MTTDLPDVTLVAVDTITHDKTLFAISKTLEQINPASVMIFSDKPEKFGIHSCFVGKIPELSSLYDVGTVMWHLASPKIVTSHILFIQYDGWVLNGDAWRSDFLNYDYIGAPWLWHSTYQVGNGGFSLRSARLMQFLASNSESFPLGNPEDDVICRKYRPDLEAEGFVFAPVPVAERFSFERSPPRDSFGFHGIFNLRHVLGNEFEIWAQTAAPYIRSKSEWRELAG